MKVYFDNAATTLLDEEVLAAMMPYLKEHFGNPSTQYSYGRDTRAAIEEARKEIAQLQNKTIKEQQFLFAIGCVYHRIHDTAKRDSFLSICEATKTLQKKDRDAILKDEISISDFQESISK